MSLPNDLYRQIPAYDEVSGIENAYTSVAARRVVYRYLVHAASASDLNAIVIIFVSITLPLLLVIGAQVVADAASPAIDHSSPALPAMPLLC